MKTARFKIDIYDFSHAPFGLYFAVRGIFTIKWKFVGAFEDRDKAISFYETIKDLPEYLN